MKSGTTGDAFGVAGGIRLGFLYRLAAEGPVKGPGRCRPLGMFGACSKLPSGNLT